MRAATVIVTLVTVVLWFTSFTLLAAPPQVQSMFPGGFSQMQHQLLGVVFFMLSLLIITLWALYLPEEEELMKAAKAPAAS